MQNPLFMKMMIPLSFLLFLVFGCKRTQNQENFPQKAIEDVSPSGDNHSFERLNYKFGNRLILEAALSLGMVKKDLLEVNNLKVDSIEAYMIPEYLSTLNDLEVEKVLKSLESDLFHTSPDPIEKISLLHEWCSTSITLNSIFENNSEEDFPFFEELIWDIPSTSIFIKNKLTNPTQDWSSLSSKQTVELNYEIINYLVSLPREKRIDFYFQYFERVNEKST